MNLILNTDSYKISHYLQYPKDVNYVSSYIESRGGRWNRVLFYGLQMFLIEYLSKKITYEDIEEAKDFIKFHGLSFNEDGWRYIVDEHGGALPLEIEAVKEGSIVQTDNVLLQIRNTDPKLPWLVGYLETAILRAIWYPVAVATNSYFCKQNILQFLNETGTPDLIDFCLHDFGARGVSSFESAGIGGSAHMVNFKGSDTITGAVFAKKYYDADMAAFSIPASEHSTMTTWGKENESDAYKNMVDKFGKSIFACVIDSYDTLNAIELWGKLFDEVKTKGGRVVLRPDSGNPVTMASECLEKMMDIAGFSVNQKGYRVLPKHIRLIYGDGINPQSLVDILNELKLRKISADNIVFGMGGALLQHLNRDTLKFAMKANAVSKDGKRWTDVKKDPITDPSKRSKSGRLALVRKGNLFKTVRLNELKKEENKLKPVFKDGKILSKVSFDDIRARVREFN
ncbi:nicotinate phosphoribosyltransferase [Campylobacter fetus]|uniref:nicotinate phosphoribosyltransferase n=2 Tax=Campylobacter fetus TaxID=196 RepID=UPI0008188F52|nr:nicotinate phosphoribosyltransferase [Campylobacter fetus]AVK80303.1 nicotinate phosphoribosyltransferase [Campylobacter fetus subsp. testudinum]MPB72292.1 nicotinate phosphoribosyltransferase [Campylobacter fetus]MPB78267.1 nicotinate phosphoribosyltransferase [Campylobacter fetus]OCR89045.1 nicotinate phosphoribosyltransferase [Campylobacter fetus subsp. testudinum]OCR92059.1 nicotinate phosphoribosyltransferase [Campylobacter fetus subsp. testudinum]